MPISRYTYNSSEDIDVAGLEILARSEHAGVGMVRCPRSGDLFVLNHLEYDADTLATEYFRDKNEGLDTAIPAHYFPQDDDSRPAINRWRPFAFLLISNWLNDLYQDTPFDLTSLSD